MREQDLLDLDFTCEFGFDGDDYYYYTYDISNLCLISPANNEVKDNEWYVEVFESPEIRFTNRTELEILITLLVNNCNKDEDNNI